MQIMDNAQITTSVWLELVKEPLAQLAHIILLAKELSKHCVQALVVALLKNTVVLNKKQIVSQWMEVITLNMSTILIH